MKFKISQGFTLIEVLISVLLLGMGTLGIMILQSQALMDSQDAYYRTQAIFLAYDITDRIRANKDHWTHINDDDAKASLTIAKKMTVENHPFCSAYDPKKIAFDPVADVLDKPDSCTEAELARTDLYRWYDLAQKMLPEGSNVEISLENDPKTTIKDNVFHVKITWPRISASANKRLGDAKITMDIKL